jgi:hypothetical protein
MPVLDLSREGSATYEVPGCCQNCDWSGVVRITKGEEAPGKMRGVNRARCERCGCRQVVAS